MPSCPALAPDPVKPFGAADSCTWSMLRFFSRSRPITGTCCSSRSLIDFWRACSHGSRVWERDWCDTAVENACMLLGPYGTRCCYIPAPTAYSRQQL